MSKDQKTLAFINLNAVLSVLERLCELDEKAKALAMTNGKEMTVAFNVTDGPIGKLVFKDGTCKFVKDDTKGGLTLKFFSCEKFNKMIAGDPSVKPLPYGNYLQAGFALKNFMQLTNILTEYLKPEPAKLADPNFFKISTDLMFHVIVGAMAEIGSHDDKGKASFKRLAPGQVQLSILGGPAAYLEKENGLFSFHKGFAPNGRSFMEFGGYDIARALFDGKTDAMECVAEGKLVMKGHIGQIDCVNRILARVANYLA